MENSRSGPAKADGAPLTAARHDRGLSTEIGRGKDANGNNLWAKHQRLSRMRREQSRGRFQSKPSETSHTAQAKFEGFRVLSNSPFGARSGVSAVPERTE